MTRPFNLGLRFQAAAWHARRFHEWTGRWPQGRHEVIARYGPTDDFAVRTPIGTSQGFCEVDFYFEVHPSGSPLGMRDDAFGDNWCAFAIAELENTNPKPNQ
jgi:hypothetical protein